MAFTYSQHVGETVKHWIDVRGLLDPGDTISGTPTVIGASDLTANSPQASTVEVTINGSKVPTAKAITVELSGGTIGTTYNVKFEFDTTNGSHLFTNTPIDVTITEDPT